MIIDAVNENRIDDAQTYTWDFVTFLVEKNDHSEPIWSNGEMSVIAAAVMCVVYDNRDRPEYQNLTNVYNFIANMCKPVNKVLPIDAYMDKLPDSHPAKKLMAIAKLAPDKMGGSFYTAALTTLRLFITNDIYSMTRESEFSLADVGTNVRRGQLYGQETVRHNRHIGQPAPPAQAERNRNVSHCEVACERTFRKAPAGRYYPDRFR